MRLSGRPNLSGPIAEVGPGDNLGSLLLMKDLGASQVVAVDRYRPRSDLESQQPIYLELAERHPRIDARLDSLGVPHAVRTEYGTPAEEYFGQVGARFEGIVSWSVMEHLYDPLSALTAMLGALRESGFLAHSVDLGDHGAFGSVQHPLEYLTIPSMIYPYLVKNSGGPNRVMLHQYREWLASSGRDGLILVHGLVGSNEDVGAVPWEVILPRRVGRKQWRLFVGFDTVSPRNLMMLLTKT